MVQRFQSLQVPDELHQSKEEEKIGYKDSFGPNKCQ
jgi:hypothetical protein